MRGQVLGVDRASGDGQIAGDDGQRYAFRPDDWSDAQGPAVGALVDFAPHDGHAARIFRAPGSAVAAPFAGAATYPARRKDRVAAALLAFFLGWLGLHKFYLGKSGAGITMALCGTIGWLLVLPGLFVAITSVIEAAIYLLTGDEVFQRRYVTGDKSWF